MKFYLDDKQFGRMIITVRCNMRNISFIAKNGALHISVPPGTPREHLEQAVEESRDRLVRLLEQSTAPAVTFHDGQRIPYYGGEIVIGLGTKNDGYIHSEPPTDGVVRLTVSPSCSFDDEWTTKAISRLISSQMEAVVYCDVRPLLEEIAAELGVKYSGFDIGRGVRKLGHCTADNVIMLSRNVALLPEHLIRYLICHELAHVTHKNHSSAFHALVNVYTGGREKALAAELRDFRWPIVQ